MPLIATMSATSIVAGALVTRTGRYKIFPLVGTVIAALGFGLYATMDADTSRTEATLFMMVVGLGLGMNMQVLTVIVQNAVEHRDLGVATAGINFCRNLGGAIGTAVTLSIFGSRLAERLAPLGVSNEVAQGSPSAIRDLPACVQD